MLRRIEHEARAGGALIQKDLVCFTRSSRRLAVKRTDNRIGHDLRHDRIRGVARRMSFLMADARVDLLFTMSDNSARAACAERADWFFTDELKSRLVEPDGIEPTTSCLQSRRSPN